MTEHPRGAGFCGGADAKWPVVAALQAPSARKRGVRREHKPLWSQRRKESIERDTMLWTFRKRILKAEDIKGRSMKIVPPGWL